MRTSKKRGKFMDECHLFRNSPTNATNCLLTKRRGSQIMKNELLTQIFLIVVKSNGAS